MPLTLLPAGPSDMPELTSIYLSAIQDTIACTCFPRASPHVREWWTSSNIDDMRNQPSARFLKVHDGPRTIAYAKWNVPIIRGDETILGGDHPDQMPSWPQDADVELCDDFFGELAKQRQTIMENRPHYCTPKCPTIAFSQRVGQLTYSDRFGNCCHAAGASG